MSHTPEPWAVGLGDDAGKYNLIAINDNDQTFVKIKPTLANADRVVACVNALAGVANPSALPEVLEAIRVLCEGRMRDSDDNIYTLECLLPKLKEMRDDY